MAPAGSVPNMELASEAGSTGTSMVPQLDPTLLEARLIPRNNPSRTWTVLYVIVWQPIELTCLLVSPFKGLCCSCALHICLMCDCLK